MTKQEFLKRLEKIINNMGIDILQVEYETVWSDPSSVRTTLEMTQDVRKNHFGEIKKLIREYDTKLNGEL